MHNWSSFHFESIASKEKIILPILVNFPHSPLPPPHPSGSVYSRGRLARWPWATAVTRARARGGVDFFAREVSGFGHGGEAQEEAIRALHPASEATAGVGHSEDGRTEHRKWSPQVNFCFWISYACVFLCSFLRTPTVNINPIISSS